MIRLLKISLGILALILAVIGALLPIFPGWPFAIVGIALISPDKKIRILNWLNSNKERIKNKIKKTPS